MGWYPRGELEGYEPEARGRGRRVLSRCLRMFRGLDGLIFRSG